MTRGSAFRITGPDGQDIGSLGDWLEHAPPKKREKHWKPGRSAMEAARAWLDDGHGPTLPQEIAEVLDSHPLTLGFVPEFAIPEWVTRLDDFSGEHRNHDLIAVGEAAAGRTLLAIEAKADESFGSHSVQSYLKLCARKESDRAEKVKKALAAGRRAPGESNAPKRIQQLSAAIFGQPPPQQLVAAAALPLRYQLLTALAGALIEAKARECNQAVFLVHEFLSRPSATNGISGTKPARVRRNATAFGDFTRSVSGNEQVRAVDGRLIGPLHVPGDARVPSDLPFLLGKVTRQIN